VKQGSHLKVLYDVQFILLCLKMTLQTQRLPGIRADGKEKIQSWSYDEENAMILEVLM